MEDVCEMKKRMIENNYNYLQELNYNWLYPLEVFKLLRAQVWVIYFGFVSILASRPGRF